MLTRIGYAALWLAMGLTLSACGSGGSDAETQPLGQRGESTADKISAYRGGGEGVAPGNPGGGGEGVAPGNPGGGGEGVAPGNPGGGGEGVAPGNPGDGGGTPMMATCRPQSTNVLTLDENSPLGFSGQDVLDNAGAEHHVALRWATGATTRLHVSVVYANGAVRFKDNTWGAPDGDADGLMAQRAWFMNCADTVEVEVQLTIRTDDGTLNDTVTATLIAEQARESRWHLDLDGIAGSLDPERFAPRDENYDSVRAWLDATFNRGQLAGKIDGQAAGADDAIAWAVQFDIASFGARRVANKR
jgi:hypothetical protein